jgi:hypothetical protein
MGVQGIVRFWLLNAHFVHGVVKAEDRHRHRFPRTISRGYNRCEVSWSVPRLITICAGFPPFNLSSVPIDIEPTPSKELDVSATESQISCNFIIEHESPYCVN